MNWRSAHVEDRSLDVQGGWFGEIGRWNVHIIEEPNRNYGDGVVFRVDRTR